MCEKEIFELFSMKIISFPTYFIELWSVVSIF